jgi:hypothetical protein
MPTRDDIFRHRNTYQRRALDAEAYSGRIEQNEDRAFKLSEVGFGCLTKQID